MKPGFTFCKTIDDSLKSDCSAAIVSNLIQQCLVTMET